MLWVKSFHIISVVAWFACLFYLPRLFVYHAMTDDPAIREQFKIMERRLYRAIGTPAMISTFVFGIWLVTFNWSYYSTSVWFWVKIALVTLLGAYHDICGSYVKKFAKDQVDKNHVFFRWFNELPTLALIVVVIMVVVRPW